MQLLYKHLPAAPLGLGFPFHFLLGFIFIRLAGSMLPPQAYCTILTQAWGQLHWERSI